LNPPNEPPYVLEPLGPEPSLAFLLDILRRNGRFSRLPENFLSLFSGSEVIIRENRDQFDYLYLREEMADLRGKKFDGKRNLIRRFQSLCPDYRFQIIDRSWKKEALNFFFSWASQKGSTENFSPLSLQDQARAQAQEAQEHRVAHWVGSNEGEENHRFERARAGQNPAR